MNTVARSTLVVVLMGSCAFARAQDAGPPPHFIFRVPLEISGIPADASYIAVRCQVQDAQGGNYGQHMSVDVAIDPQTGRPVDTVAEVPLRLDAQFNPYEAVSYRCELTRPQDRSGGMGAIHSAERGIDTSRPLVQSVTGTLPLAP